jgi:oxalate decarboxylase/phosphoglucose isomerase-like protein (cupin superfamily)
VTLHWLSTTFFQKIIMTNFTKVVLFTDTDGKARFKEESLTMGEGSPQSQLTEIFKAEGYQLRYSPVGFRSQFHTTGKAQWLFILSGQMEIGLQDGSSKVFGPGEHFFSADLLPKGAVFDPKVHGHCSRQVGEEALVTVFVRV